MEKIFYHFILFIGKDEIDGKDLKNFIEAHKNLKFLGLVHSDACYEDCLMNPSHQNYRPDLVVSSRELKKNLKLPNYKYKC